MANRMRLDKWLWAARFYKTRSLAVAEIGKGRVLVNNQAAKPSRDLGVGDTVCIQRQEGTIEVCVCGLSNIRGPAPVARELYEETSESVVKREHAAEMKRLAPEPALHLSTGRPTKRDRRLIDQVRRGGGD